MDVQDSGIFEVLERGWLHAVEFIITASTAFPLQVVEKYTYHFRYQDGEFQGVSIPGKVGRVVSLKTIKQDMRAILKRILEFDRLLPTLPSKDHVKLETTAY